MRKVATLIIAAFVISILSLQFQYNILGIWNMDVFDSFQMDSEQSVRLMVERIDRDGWGSTGGMMLLRDLNGPPYESSCGLQGKIITFFWMTIFRNLENLWEYFSDWQIINSIILAYVICGFSFWVYRVFGVIPAITFIVLSSLSIYMVFAARNIYLWYWSALIPFMLSLVLHPLRNKDKYNYKITRQFCVIVAAPVFFHSLCSLDYCSNIVLSTACGSIFWGVYRDKNWIDVLCDGFCAVVFSAAAVLLAVVLTGLQAGVYEGSIVEGFRQLYVAASSRSYGSLDIARCASPNLSLWTIVDAYLMLPVLSLPFDGTYHIYFSFFALVCVLAVLSSSYFLRKNILTRALIYTTWWGFFCTISWAFLMKGHMAHHLHMNGMIFYIPFALLVYVLVGCFINRLWRRKAC